MKFRQKSNESISYEGRPITAKNGVFEVAGAIADAMIRSGYEQVAEKIEVTSYTDTEEVFSDGGQAEQANAEGQEAKKEPSYIELRKQAKEAGIENYGKMNKEALKKALEE